MSDISNLLIRRVEKVLPSEAKLKETLEKRKIRVYQGFDPTGSRLHIGHAIGLKKLMDFANAGHEVIFLFGTGTVLVGDPSQRDSARKEITQDQIEENIKDWKKQAEKVVDFSKITIKQNSEWLLDLKLHDIINIASNISAVQLFKREMFQRRLDKGDTIWYHETMYPILQGYDSVAMDVDLEIGGTDQEFNMLIGRELQKKMNDKEKFVLTVPMILGTDGKQMSKSSGNCVWLDDSPEDMYGKIMSIPDEQIVPYLELVTDVPLDKVEEVRRSLKDEKVNPMDAKKDLAYQLVKELHSEDEADESQKNFKEAFQKGVIPDNIEEKETEEESMNLLDMIDFTGLVESRSQAKRLINQDAIEINGQVESDPKTKLDISKDGLDIRIGKTRFIRVKRK